MKEIQYLMSKPNAKGFKPATKLKVVWTEDMLKSFEETGWELVTPIDTTITYSDWRLPTIQELLTLVDYETLGTACKLGDTDGMYNYWSSTNYAASPTTLAWVVDFNNGKTWVDPKLDTNFVRCVRDGEDGLEWSESSKLLMTWPEALVYAENLEE